MRLTKVTIWNYRSYWSDDTEGNVEEVPSVAIDLSSGVNYLVGPNNVGKSNLLRAIALALDPNARYEPDIDRPQAKSWGPSIELEFTVGPAPSAAVKQLVKDVDAYERTIDGFADPSLASQGKLCFYVGYWKGSWRDERFLTRTNKNSGKVRGPNNKRLKAVERFYDLVRFVDIKSGEDLQDLLQRGFKEILSSAMGAGLSNEMKHADEAREAYVEALGKVLRPVGKHVEDRIKRYVRGISEVDLVANVPPVKDAIADAQVFITDAVRTALDQKGTGVRGAMLLLLLSFIAESAKSAVVFGIEEPEAFLHPDAHRELGAGLEHFTQRDDVTLLVTSHSPFIFRAEGSATTGRNAVFVVRKDEEGRSSVAKDVTAAARTDLLGSQVLSLLLEKAEEVPDKAKLVLLVEGETDAKYLQIAAQRLSIPIDDIHIVFWTKRGANDLLRGAGYAAVQAVTLGARHAPARVVVALFDTDDDGKRGYEMLTKSFGWKNKKPDEGLFALTYEQWLSGYNVPVEAEDIFENVTIDMFLAGPGNKAFCTGTKLREKAQRWHYDLSPLGKIAFVQWLDQHGTVATFEPWRPVLEHLRKLIANATGKIK